MCIETSFSFVVIPITTDCLNVLPIFYHNQNIYFLILYFTWYIAIVFIVLSTIVWWVNCYWKQLIIYFKIASRENFEYSQPKEMIGVQGGEYANYPDLISMPVCMDRSSSLY